MSPNKLFPWLLACLVLSPGLALAETLTWNPPDSRVDGTPLLLEEIFQYELCVSPTPECGADSRFFETTQTRLAIESFDLPAGNWYFTVRTVDTNGLQSEWADFVSHRLIVAPSPPTELRVE